MVRGVYASANHEDTIDFRVAAIALVVPDHHVVTDRTAAWIHDVDAHTYGEHDGVPPIEWCALRWHAPTTLSGTDGRTRDLSPSDVMTIHGVQVTTPVRTTLDLGCGLRRREAFAAMCMLARRHDFTRTDLQREVPRFRRRRGVVQLRGLVPLIDSRFESHREAWCFLAIADAGLSLPEPQVWIDVEGVPTYRLDLAYRRRRIVVEYDGHDAHDSAEQKEHDRKRREWLREHGWIVIVVREGDFTGEGLERWLGELRSALDPTYSNRRW